MAIIIVDNWAAVAQASIPVTPGIVSGWSDPLAQMSVSLEPSEVIIAGWAQLAQTSVRLEPSEIIIAGWKRVSQTTVDLLTPGGACSTDDDCPEGYVCEDGVCVKKGTPFPWGWLAVIGGAAAGAAAIIKSRQKKKKTK